MNFIWLFVMFFALMALGIPVAIALLCSSAIYMWIFDMSFMGAMTQSIFAPMSATLLSMGFFIFAGNLMNNGGVTNKIFDFSKKLVCWLPGGLGHANIIASLIFAGMSGTALGDAGGLGKIELEAMRNEGYDDDFSLAVTGASSVLGPIIPPSVPMVMFAVMTGISTGKLFMAGVIPGLISCIAMMVLVYLIAKKRGYPSEPLPPLKVWTASFKNAFFALLTPVIMLYCIYTGVVTPSESAVVAGVYAIILGLLSRDLKIKDIPNMVKETVELMTSVLFIVLATKFFGYILTIEQVPKRIADLLLQNISSPLIAMVLMAILLIICGCVMDNNATIMIVTPVLFPAAVALGIDPVQFGLVFNFTLMIGVITPPVGMVLFVLKGMSDITFGKLCKAVTPFIIVLFVVDFLLILFPGLSTWLPSIIYN